MMKRFLRIKGKPGLLVADPRALDAQPRRFAGQKRVRPLDGNLADCFDPVEQVIEDHSLIRKAIARGELELLDTQNAASIDKVLPRLKPKKD